jgi:DoxX-like family
MEAIPRREPSAADHADSQGVREGRIVKPDVAARGSEPSTRARWLGRILSGLAVLFLLFDATIKLFKLPVAVEATTRLGYPESVMIPLGLIEVSCLIAYLVPARQFSSRSCGRGTWAARWRRRCAWGTRSSARRSSRSTSQHSSGRASGCETSGCARWCRTCRDARRIERRVARQRLCPRPMRFVRRGVTMPGEASGSGNTPNPRRDP